MAMLNNSNSSLVSGTNENDVIYNNATNVTINAGDGNDSIGNHGGHENGNDFIDGGEGADSILNNGAHSSQLKAARMTIAFTTAAQMFSSNIQQATETTLSKTSIRLQHWKLAAALAPILRKSAATI